jgi:hypothetical protein
MKQNKMNCRGKTDSSFLINAYLISDDAAKIAVMLSDMTKNYSLYNSQLQNYPKSLPYLI